MKTKITGIVVENNSHMENVCPDFAFDLKIPKKNIIPYALSKKQFTPVTAGKVSISYSRMRGALPRWRA